jgi:hypothetical protein
MNKYYLLIILSISILFIYSFNVTNLESFKIKDRVCFDPKISSKEKEIFIELIKIVSNILKKNNIKWIPIGGNLLALYRHNNLLIPWDDDYDIVIEEDKVNLALNILKKELPKYNANIIEFRKWGKKNGKLYKVFYKKNHPKYKNYLSNYKKYQHTWPFIDIFVNVEHMDKLVDYAHNLKYTEYPLKKKIIEGIELYVPTRGPRTFQKYKESGMLTECRDDTYMHKFEKRMKCSGPIKKKCSDLI